MDKQKPKKSKSTKTKLSVKKPAVKDVVEPEYLNGVKNRGITTDAWDYMNEIEDLKYEIG